MSVFWFDDDADMRPAIKSVLPDVWSRLGRPGTWLTGEQRVAAAAEARQARQCRLCAARKQALSPSAVSGQHDTCGDLPQGWVEVIHRVVTDSGRLAKGWYRSVTASGLSEAEYVELVGVVVTVVAIDTFCSAMGRAAPVLPEALPGVPGRAMPDQLDRELAWVPTLDPSCDGPLQREFYQGGPAHIRRALTLVPQTARDFWDMAFVLYLSGPEMRDFDHEYRAISHAQIELLAGRVSALNQCLY